MVQYSIIWEEAGKESFSYFLQRKNKVKSKDMFNSDLSMSMEVIYFSFLMDSGVIKLVVCTGG